MTSLPSSSLPHHVVGRISRTVAVLALSICASGLAQAHPGHGFTHTDPAHLVSSPDHALTLSALIISGVLLHVVAFAFAERRPRLALRFAGIMTICSAWILGGGQA